MIETIMLSELINVLKSYYETEGDIPVFHQRDPEGNGYGTINDNSIYCDKSTKIGTALFIHPFDEGIEQELYSWYD